MDRRRIEPVEFGETADGPQFGGRSGDAAGEAFELAERFCPHGPQQLSAVGAAGAGGVV